MTFTNVTKESITHQLKTYGENNRFLTITIKPSFYKFSSITQLELTNNLLYGILSSHSDNFSIVAEHTASANVHYHALITNFSKYGNIALMNALRRNRSIGFVKLDGQSIRDSEALCNYMMKDVESNCKAFKGRGCNPNFTMDKETWQELTLHKL